MNPLRHLDPVNSVLLPALMYILSGGRFIFAAAKPTPVDLRNTRNPRLANLVVSAAGPVSNLLLASIAIGALLVIKATAPQSIVDLALAVQGDQIASGALAPVNYVLLRFALVNVMLAVFNLIPIPPLDGSNVLYGLLPPRQKYSWRTYQQYGPILLLLLLFFGSQILRVVIYGPAVFLFNLFTGTRI